MTTSTYDAIGERLAQGESLAAGDLELLAENADILTLGMLADDLRRQRHGARTTFVRVAQVPVAAALEGRVTWAGSPREIRLIGGFEDIEAARAAVRATTAAAGPVPVTGFALSDLAQAAGGDAARVEQWLTTLAGDGLAAISEAALDQSGDGAALLAAAKKAGVRVSRLVVHQRYAGGPLAMVRAVAALQAATGAIDVFAPVARQTGSEPTTGYEDVRAVALARIALPDVAHIQVDWTLHGPKLAQVALTFGADDLDNVSPLDEIAEGRRRAPLEEVRRNIRSASLEPIERDGRFTVVG